jgi:hypothetical protein
VGAWIERGEPDDPWSGRQPRYDRLVSEGGRYFLDARLPSGEPIRCQLGRLTSSMALGMFTLKQERPGHRGLLARVHNPRNRICACLPECWCKRSRLGYALRWYVPARWHRLPPPPPGLAQR